MRQNIKVEVVPAPQGWPRVYSQGSEARQDGARYLVWADDEECHLGRWTEGRMKGDPSFVLSSWWLEIAAKPVFDIGGACVGFPDFESAAAWWLDPKPVGGSPAPIRAPEAVGMWVENKELGLVKVLGADKDGIVRCVPADTRFPAGYMTDRDLVTPFYGTVTITVSPDSTENP